jgi:hypothetical protein
MAVDPGHFLREDGMDVGQALGRTSPGPLVRSGFSKLCDGGGSVHGDEKACCFGVNQLTH